MSVVSFPERGSSVLRFLVRGILALSIAVSLPSLGLAQQGHPLDGTWYGDWGPSPTHRNPVVVIIRYDGENLNGLINPGPDAVPLDVVRLDPTNWTVHMEAEATNDSGATFHYVVDGQIENLGLPNRSMTGSWNHDGVQGDFRLVRN